jgi:hypothetical protein
MLKALTIITAFGLAAYRIALAPAAAPTKDGRELVLTDSRLDNVKFIAADAEWNWTFKPASDEEAKSVAAKRVVRFGDFAQPVGHHRVRLASGGELLCYFVEIVDGRIRIESDLLDTATLPADLATAIVFDAPADARELARLEERISDAAKNQDVLLFANGDQLAGQLVGLANDSVTLKVADRDVVVERTRVAAVVLNSTRDAQDPAGELSTWIGLHDGSRVFAQKLVVENDRATIELVASASLSTPAAAIVALQPIGGDVVYLSDLNAASYRHIPFLSLPWEYRLDHNVTGGPLVAAKRLHLKGLGMHSAARITYNLDGDYRRFQSELAIDDSTSGRGSVSCRVFIDDGSGNWQNKYESPVIRGGAKPLAVDVDIAGAKRISLLVDFADGGDELDHVDWLDARVIK